MRILLVIGEPGNEAASSMAITEEELRDLPLDELSDRYLLPLAIAIKARLDLGR